MVLSVGWDHRQPCRPTAEEPEEEAALPSWRWANRGWEKRPQEQTQAEEEEAPSRHGRWSKAKAAREGQEERVVLAAALLLPLCSAWPVLL